MAARNPTGFTQWIDERSMVSKQQVLASDLDEIFNDQQFIFDMEQLVIMDFFRPRETSLGTFVEAVKYDFITTDTCAAAIAAAGNISHEWSALCSLSAGSPLEGEVRFGGTTTTIPVGTTTPTWIAFGAANSLQSNHVRLNGADGLVEIRVSAGSGNVRIYGFFLCSTEL